MIDDRFEEKKRDVKQIVETLQAVDGARDGGETDEDLDELLEQGLDAVSALRELVDTDSGSVTIIGE